MRHLYHPLLSAPRSQGRSRKREWKSLCQPEVKKDQTETVSSGCDRATALMNSQHLRLLTQDRASHHSRKEVGSDCESLSPAQELLTAECFWGRETQIPLRVNPWKISQAFGMPHTHEYLGSIYWNQWVIFKKQKTKSNNNKKTSRHEVRGGW